MSLKIENVYYVGKNQPYQTVNQAINTIAATLGTNNYTLPSSSAPDGGQINIVIKGSGKFPPIKIPDNTTGPLKNANRYLVIKRQEYKEDGTLIADSMPVISPMAQSGSEIQEADKLIGIDVGSNNPNVKIIGLRVNGFVIGLNASFNSNDLYISRCFFTNSVNAQVYVNNIQGLYVTNNIIVGGQYGLVATYTKNIRAYHNTIFLDGLTAFNGETKAGVILQGERLFNNIAPSTIYFLGNLVYTIGCPATIFYEEDLKNNRLVSDYNDLYSQTAIAQIRQDNATLASDSSQVIKQNYLDLFTWRAAGPLGPDNNARVDQNSISVHPVFIQNISIVSSTASSIVNLGLIDNSPLLQKVPAWYFETDSTYIPSDLDEELLSVDSLLSTRQQPFTSIGANDKQSINGFFGQDIFTSPLDLDPEKKCDLDPLNLVSSQEISMNYPSINAGYFWSHEREYYLYGKKAAYTLGYIAQTSFVLPGNVDPKLLKVYIGDKEIPKESWDLIGRTFILSHKNHGIYSYQDEVQLHARVQYWHNNGFAYQDAYYVFKIADGITKFILPKEYQSSAPIVITDDRISYLNASDAVKGDFKTVYDSDAGTTEVVFGGNENLFENSDFSYTFSGSLPSYWIAPTQTSPNNVYRLPNRYSYFGDHAVALALYNDPGYITSQKIEASYDKPICLSWHAALPTGITGSTGQYIDSTTGHYNVTFYDNYDEQMAFSIDGSFEVSTSSYKRFCLTLGPSDVLMNLSQAGVPSAPLIRLNTEAITIPTTVTKLELTLSGANYSGQMSPNAFYILDAVQAEYANNPSYYHPKPSFNNMTIEFETDQSGVFVDKRMNVTPIFNENPNGFLYISDMPATIWGGPTDPEVTTLHEYRWPHGRMNVLPWGRLFGKDKLVERSVLKSSPGNQYDVIVPYVFPRKGAEANITPAVIRVTQGSELPDGFNVQVLDDIKNAYGLRNYVAHVYEPNGNFPGWLSKQYYGAKEQLGSTIFGALNNNGSFSAFYNPPSANHIRYIGTIDSVAVPSSTLTGVMDTIGFIKTNYNVSTENNGNITIIGQDGRFHNTADTELLSGVYTARSDNSKIYVALEYPPVFGSVKITNSSVKLYETQSIPQTNEFFVNYTYGHIELSSEFPVSSTFQIQYNPKYVYPSPQEKNRVIIHTNKVLSGYTGPVQIDYDAEINLELRVADPLNREFVATFPIVLQNPQLAYITNQSIQLEF